MIGGRYGIYVEQGHCAQLVVGLRLSGQEDTPIALGGFAPFGLVGFQIVHDGGRVVSAITGRPSSRTVGGKLASTFHDSSGHVFLVDGSVEVTGGDAGGGAEILANTDRSVYLRNVYVKGLADVLANDATPGRLRVSAPDVWTRVGELAYSGPYASLYGVPGCLIAGRATDQTYYDGALYQATADLVVTEARDPPADLIARHTYDAALTNVEGADVVWVTDHGADPNDPGDDTAGIQAAIDAAAASGSDRVFLPAGQANPQTLTNRYRVSGTLRLGERTRLVGATRYSSVLDATGWAPAADSPVIETVDSASAQTTIADFKVVVPRMRGDAVSGYAPHVYALRWRAGRRSLLRNVNSQPVWADPAGRGLVVISDSGGGRWYQHVSDGDDRPPPDVNPDPSVEDRPYTNAAGALLRSPDSRKLLIDGTQEPLVFYSFHLRAGPRRAAP